MKTLMAMTLAAGLFVSVASTSVRAGENEYHGRVEKLKTELALTPEQVTKIQQIFVEAYGSKEKLKAMSEADRKAYMKSKQPEVQEKVKAVLTAEQVQKFMQMKKNHH